MTRYSRRNAEGIPYKEVAGAVREHILAEGSAELFRIRWDLARKLGERAIDSYGALTDRYCSQVLRALNEMAENGTLVKDAPHRTSVWFYTQEAWAAKQKADEEARARHNDVVTQWAGVYDQLEAAGYHSTAERGAVIKLGLADWKKLANLAQWSASAGSMIPS
jgi:hypothetical protein